MGFKQVARCRICGNQRLVTVLDLGEQCLTGVFPRSIGELDHAWTAAAGEM